jgi:SAM-dependent methyltransferase
MTSSPSPPPARPLSTSYRQIVECLPLRPGQRLLENGCGQARTLRQLAEAFPDVSFLATDVDRQQMEHNRLSPKPANLVFRGGGAEQIQLPDRSVHYVVMLKSLHHVPVEWMGRSLREIARVLVPGGLAFLSEPVYAGNFNEVLRLFHDERRVREAAIAAIRDAVRGGLLEQVRRIEFDELRNFQNFADFERQVIQVTHSNFDLDGPKLERVRRKFESFAGPDGSVTFATPQRIDLLRRPAAATTG